jgi:hypothetical protein
LIFIVVEEKKEILEKEEEEAGKKKKRLIGVGVRRIQNDCLKIINVVFISRS